MYNWFAQWWWWVIFKDSSFACFIWVSFKKFFSFTGKVNINVEFEFLVTFTDVHKVDFKSFDYN